MSDILLNSTNNSFSKSLNAPTELTLDGFHHYTLHLDTALLIDGQVDHELAELLTQVTKLEMTWETYHVLFLSFKEHYGAHLGNVTEVRLVNTMRVENRYLDCFDFEKVELHHLPSTVISLYIINNIEEVDESVKYVSDLTFPPKNSVFLPNGVKVLSLRNVPGIIFDKEDLAKLTDFLLDLDDSISYSRVCSDVGREDKLYTQATGARDIIRIAEHITSFTCRNVNWYRRGYTEEENYTILNNKVVPAMTNLQHLSFINCSFGRQRLPKFSTDSCCIKSLSFNLCRNVQGPNFWPKTLQNLIISDAESAEALEKMCVAEDGSKPLPMVTKMYSVKNDTVDCMVME